MPEDLNAFVTFVHLILERYYVINVANLDFWIIFGRIPVTALVFMPGA